MGLLPLLASASLAMSVRQTSLRVSGMPEAPALALGRLLAEAAPAAGPEPDLALRRLAEQLARRPDLETRDNAAANLLYSALGEAAFERATAGQAGIAELNSAAQEIRRVAREEAKAPLEALARSRPGARAALLRVLSEYSLFLTQPELEEWSGRLAYGPSHRAFLSRTLADAGFLLDMEPRHLAALFEEPGEAASAPAERAERTSAPRVDEILYPAALADWSSGRGLQRLFPDARLHYNDALIPSEAVNTQNYLAAHAQADPARLRDQIDLLRALFFEGGRSPRNIAHQVIDAARGRLRFLFHLEPADAPVPGRQFVDIEYHIGRMEAIERRFPAVFVHYPGFGGALAQSWFFWKSVLSLIEPGGRLLLSRKVFDAVSPGGGPPRFGRAEDIPRLLDDAFEAGAAFVVPGMEPLPKTTKGREVLVFKRRG